MDPVTHAVLGASAARVGLSVPLGRAAWLPGAVGALLPDVDAFIRSSADSLLYVEFHRHFTHSLAFIPIGGAVAALPWLLRRVQWPAYLAAATLGYATHGLLDASTTYGTSLLWPFSETRVAWNVISIVDPLFTLILFCGLAFGLWRRSARPAAAALLICGVYLGTGAVQRDRALAAQEAIAAARGDGYERGAVFPGFGNQVVWRSLYRAGNRLYMDRIRVPPGGGAPAWSPGATALLLEEDGLPPANRADPRALRDFRRFRRFTNGWVAPAEGDPALLGDARYSMVTGRYEPVWGIRLTPAGTKWINRSGTRRVDPRALWQEFRGKDPSYRAVPQR